MQLWEVKNEAGNRALHSQLISSLFEKAPALIVQVSVVRQDRSLCTETGLWPDSSVYPDPPSVPLPCRGTHVCMMQAASVANTPLVSQAVSSPIVARSLLADPAEREVLLALPYSRSHKTKGGLETGPQLGAHAITDSTWRRQAPTSARVDTVSHNGCAACRWRQQGGSRDPGHRDSSGWCWRQQQQPTASSIRQPNAAPQQQHFQRSVHSRFHASRREGLHHRAALPRGGGSTARGCRAAL